MAATYRIFGSELSPYSVKVRSYFRYKDIPHEWVLRSTLNQAEFDRHAKLPLIPLVLAPDGTALQDSTPIIERMEALHPEPSIHPTDPATAFVSALARRFTAKASSPSPRRCCSPASAISAAIRARRFRIWSMC